MWAEITAGQQLGYDQVAAAHSRDTLPVNGIFSGMGASGTLNYSVDIRVSKD
jgi:hypothetical protein